MHVPKNLALPTVRVPLIFKKFSDHFPNWAKVVPWAKGQIGQIWANLVKK